MCLSFKQSDFVIDFVYVYVTCDFVIWLGFTWVTFDSKFISLKCISKQFRHDFHSTNDTVTHLLLFYVCLINLLCCKQQCRVYILKITCCLKKFKRLYSIIITIKNKFVHDAYLTLNAIYLQFCNILRTKHVYYKTTQIYL